jgi:redox-sensitive bicupin YhaK (pirin superfamily)
VGIRALEDACIAVIGGEHMSQRYIEWNFVSSSMERIDQARQNWMAGRFPLVPGDEEEFIPLP